MILPIAMLLNVAHRLACVASVSSDSSRKLGREQKKKGMTGKGEGNEGTACQQTPSLRSMAVLVGRAK